MAKKTKIVKKQTTNATNVKKQKRFDRIQLTKMATKTRIENANQFSQNQMQMPSTSSLELEQARTSSTMDSKKRRLNEDGPKEDEIARMRKHRRAKVDRATQTERRTHVDGATQTERRTQVDGATQTDWTEHEAVHAHFNRLIDRYRNTGNSMAAFEKMARHQTLWNALYDCGHGKDVDVEQIDEENDENIPPIN